MTVMGSLTEVVLAKAAGIPLDHARATIRNLEADGFALVPKVLTEMVEALATIDPDDEASAEDVLARIESMVTEALADVQRRVAEATAP